MPLGTFISGAYTSSYGGSAIGITRNGYELAWNGHAEEINESDIYGDTLIDLVYRGGSLRIRWESKEYKTGPLTAFWPWGTSIGTIATAAAPIGRLGSNVASPQVFTDITATPAETNPATATAALAILSPQSNLSLMLDSRLRHVPIDMVALPSDSAGTVTFLTLT